MSQRINAASHRIRDIVSTNPMVAGVTMGMVIDFDVNSADVKSEYYKELTKVATFLKENNTITATVEGHTANLQTTPALAQEISQRRAQNIVNYLVNAEGIHSSRLTAEAFAEARRYTYSTGTESPR
jgi:OOP family OmpA-OmpF porin